MQNIFSRLTKRKTAKLSHKSKAQSLAEFAITLPVLLLLLSGVVEFGFALNYYLSLLDATREAARFYSNGEPFNTDGTDDMDFYSAAASMAVANLDPSVVPGNESYVGRKIELDTAADDVLVTVYAKSETGTVLYPASGVYQLFNNSISLFTATEIENRFESGSPNAGVLVVEVHYTYNAVMNLPWISPLFPMQLRAYTIMPLAAAEPEEATP